MKTKYKKLVEQRSALLNEAKALNAQDDLTAEQRGRVDEILKKVDDLDFNIKTTGDLITREEEAKKIEERFTPDDGLETGATEIRVGEDRDLENYTLGNFLQDVRTASSETRQVPDRLTRYQKKEIRSVGDVSGASVGVGSDGGFLVGSQMQAGLVERMNQESVMAGRCMNIPVGTGYNSVTYHAVDEASRATGSRFGGVQVYWEGEAGTATDTKPKLKEQKVSMRKLMGIFYATDELLRDATALEAFVQRAFSTEMAWRLDDAILNGDGAGLPLGILNSGALTTVAKESGQTADTVNYTNIIKMWNAMPASVRRRAVWYINQDVEVQLQQMSLPVGTGGSAVFLPAGGASVDQYSTLYGRPIVPIEQCSALGDVGDIVLADMGSYMLTTKDGVQMDSSIHVRFLYGENTYRFQLHRGGQPIFFNTITAANGSTERSEFVALATR